MVYLPIMCDIVSLQAKGIGYIEFSNESEARKAVVRMNGMVRLAGLLCKCNIVYIVYAGSGRLRGFL